MSERLRIACIGDCCADIYPQQERVLPGGTAFNVAIQVREAGAEASIISAIGTDVHAELFLRVIEAHAINNTHLSVIQGHTSSVKIQLDKNGEHSFSEWDLGVLKEYTLSPQCEVYLRDHHAVRIVLFRPLVHILDRLCGMKLSDTFRVVDFAGASTHGAGITMIKKYIHGFDMLVKTIEESNMHVLPLLKQISTEGKLVLVLLGEQGSAVYYKGKEYQQPAIATMVTDTNGAGDAYVGNFMVTYLQTSNIEEAMYQGALAATRVIEHLGANSACLVQNNNVAWRT